MDDRRGQITRELGALHPKTRRLLARAGWVAAGAAVVAIGGVIFLKARGRPLTDSTVAVLILGALVCTGTAVQFLGAPFARPGPASRFKIVVLVVAAALGVALAVAASAVIGLGVAYLLYVIAFLTMAGRRPTE